MPQNSLHDSGRHFQFKKIRRQAAPESVPTLPRQRDTAARLRRNRFELRYYDTPGKVCKIQRRATSLASEDVRIVARVFPVSVEHVFLTSPSFCTTASERVYITTSSDNANGGSQGAVGDRRAAICGANVAGAGAL